MIGGIVRIDTPEGSVYTVSFRYTQNNLNFSAGLAQISGVAGEEIVSCQDISFGAEVNVVTAPLLASEDALFVGLGAALSGGGVGSRVRGFSQSNPGDDWTAPSAFGVNGMTEWFFPYATSNPNNNQSKISRLFYRFDPLQGSKLFALGSRLWNAQDFDVTMSRLGSHGVFIDGFEPSF